MTDVITAVRGFLRANVDRMGKRPGNSTHGSFAPDPQQVSSREYLAYAESEFATRSTQATINCVGHLKRAVDSQIENFLAHYGLHEFARSNNLSVRSKLEFLEKTPGRALRRFNAVRNRIEHEFERPN